MIVTPEFKLGQCETADDYDGPWRDIVDGKTARFVRIKPAEWEAALWPHSAGVVSIIVDVGSDETKRGEA